MQKNTMNPSADYCPPSVDSSPWLLFYRNHFCLNLSVFASDLHFDVPNLLILYECRHLISPTRPLPPLFRRESMTQLFQYGFVLPTWAMSLISLAFVALICAPSIFRFRPGYCSTCNYNLKGLTASACPECGTKLVSS
jgi:hypothetical protein